MKSRKTIISLILSVALILGALPTALWGETVVKAADYGVKNPRVVSSQYQVMRSFIGAENCYETAYYNGKKVYRTNWWTTWDCVYFGNYYQNSSTQKEPIKWRVLSVNDEDAFLLADQVLDCQPETPKNATWETSDVWAWLNDEFCKTAFTEEEQKAIKGKVDIPTAEDVVTRAYGFTPVEIFEAPWERIATATAYARSRGVFYLDNLDARKYSAQWAVRAVDPKSKLITMVDNMGGLNISGMIIGISDKGNIQSWDGYDESRDPNPAPVIYPGIRGRSYGESSGAGMPLRPVLHLDLSSSVWREAGTISDGNTYPEKKVTAPARVQKLTVKNNKKKTVTVTWKKSKGAKGYQLQYGTDRTFKKKHGKQIKKTKAVIKKLAKKKTWYFRVRAYKLDGKKKVYGIWSSVKKLQIKK